MSIRDSEHFRKRLRNLKYSGKRPSLSRGAVRFWGSVCYHGGCGPLFTLGVDNIAVEAVAESLLRQGTHRRYHRRDNRAAVLESRS